MNGQGWLRALHPEPEVGQLDTSLRYTDILFGFVIKELFSRLHYWNRLSLPVKMHLLVGTILVLGSWIGYRRSLNRSMYEVKFFNLPFFRFLADQLMLILYFGLAVMTDVPATHVPANLAGETLKLVILIFVLYWIWDLLGIRMACAKDPFDSAKPLYPKVKDKAKTTEAQQPDQKGLVITSGALALLLSLWLLPGSPDQVWPERWPGLRAFHHRKSDRRALRDVATGRAVALRSARTASRGDTRFVTRVCLRRRSP